MSYIPKQLSASLEDYLEAILVLSQAGRVARSKDIAEHLQVARSSVTGALRALAEKQLVHYKPYGFITLTERGQRLAGRIARRHKVLESFFSTVLGVDMAIAQRSACMAEHAIGPEITDRLMTYLDFLSAEKQAGRNVTEAFKNFCMTAEQKAQSSLSEHGLADQTLKE